MLLSRYSLVSGPEDHPGSRNSVDPDALAKMVDRYDVIAFFHGHFHGTEHYVWNGGDVYNIGSPMRKTMTVIRVFGDRMSAATWDWGSESWVWQYTTLLEGASL